MSLKNMTEEEKKARKRKQKNEAQKRYYQKNKVYYKNYSKQWSKENLLKKDKEIEKLKNKINKAIETINYYAIENEDYSKIYNKEEQELLEILEGEDNKE